MPVQSFHPRLLLHSPESVIRQHNNMESPGQTDGERAVAFAVCRELLNWSGHSELRVSQSVVSVNSTNTSNTRERDGMALTDQLPLLCLLLSLLSLSEALKVRLGGCWQRNNFV